jgi:hypothetical protein
MLAVHCKRSETKGAACSICCCEHRSAHQVDNQLVDALLAAQATLGGILDTESSCTTLRAAQGQVREQEEHRLIHSCVLPTLGGLPSTKYCPSWRGLRSYAELWQVNMWQEVDHAWVRGCSAGKQSACVQRHAKWPGQRGMCEVTVRAVAPALGG